MAPYQGWRKTTVVGVIQGAQQQREREAWLHHWEICMSSWTGSQRCPRKTIGTFVILQEESKDTLPTQTPTESSMDFVGSMMFWKILLSCINLRAIGKFQNKRRDTVPFTHGPLPQSLQANVTWAAQAPNQHQVFQKPSNWQRNPDCPVALMQHPCIDATSLLPTRGHRVAAPCWR